MIDKRPIIGVMGSHEKSWDAYAAPLGRLIAEYDYHLLTGAGAGVMSTVAQAFTAVEERAGLSIGIVPTVNYDGSFVPREQYPNPFIEIPVLTPLDKRAAVDVNPYSRNHVNIMTSHAVVVLPGEHGTQNEVALALQYHKPMVLFGPEEAFKGFPEQVTIVDEIEAVREFLDTVKASFRKEEG
jgi:uncharacterized protein (TIGR00725 family)